MPSPQPHGFEITEDKLGSPYHSANHLPHTSSTLRHQALETSGTWEDTESWGCHDIIVGNHASRLNYAGRIRAVTRNEQLSSSILVTLAEYNFCEPGAEPARKFPSILMTAYKRLLVYAPFVLLQILLACRLLSGMLGGSSQAPQVKWVGRRLSRETHASTT